MLRFILSSFLLAFAANSFAIDWSKPWLNKNQQGLKAVEQEDYATAAELFSDSQWQAFSQYKQGNFEQAAELFNEDSPASAFNKGNALAHMGDLDAAIAAYEKALELDPNFEDAQLNKALVEELKKQQEQEQQQENSDENQQSDGDENDSSEQSQEQDSADENQQGGEQADSDQNDNEQNDSSDQDQNQDQSEESEQEDSDQQAEQNLEEDADNEDEQQSSAEQTDENTEQDNSAAAIPEESELSPEEQEELRQLEQWLRGVEDDPGQLLRNKFRYQYEQNRRKQQHFDRESDQVW